MMRAEERRLWRAIRREPAGPPGECGCASRCSRATPSSPFSPFPIRSAIACSIWGSPRVARPGAAAAGARRALARAGPLSGLRRGLAAHAAILHWIYVVTVVYGERPRDRGHRRAPGPGRLLGAFTALFAAGMAVLRPRAPGLPLDRGLLWTALDHLRTFALSGFPWATLGYAQHENVALLAHGPLHGRVRPVLRQRARRRGAGPRRRRDLGPRAADRRPGVARARVRRRRRTWRAALRRAPDATNPTSPRVRVAVAPGEHRPGREVERSLGRAHPRDYEDARAGGGARGAPR